MFLQKGKKKVRHFNVHCSNIKMWYEEFPTSKNAFCIPAVKVGTLQASQDVGIASYKTRFYTYVKTGFYLYSN